MFTSLVRSMQQLIVPFVRTPVAPAFDADAVVLDDDFEIIDRPDSRPPSRSSSPKPSPPDPALVPSPPSPPTARLTPVTVQDLLTLFPRYAEQIPAINMHVASSVLSGMMHILDNKPTLWTPSFFGLVGSEARLQNCLLDAQVTARERLEIAATQTQALCDAAVSAFPHLSWNAVAEQVLADLRAEWGGSEAGFLADCLQREIEKCVPTLSWDGKLEIVESKIVAKLDVSAPPELSIFGGFGL